MLNTLSRITQRSLAIALIGGMLLASQTSSAQDVDSATLDLVANAFTSTQAVQSFAIHSTSATQITGFGDLQQQEERLFQVVQTEDGLNASGTSTSTTTLPGDTPTEMVTTTEVVLLDGQLYLRVTGLSEEMAASMPEGWFIPEETEDAEAAPMIGAAFDENTVTGLLNLPISAESISAISELDADTIGDQGMRVFQLTFNPDFVAENETLALFGGFNPGAGFGQGGGFGPGAGGFIPPEGAPALPTPSGDGQAPTGDLEFDGQITLAVWIGDDDGLIHRVYSVVTLTPTADPTAAQQMPAGLSFQVTTVTDFTDFNAPFEIIAPEVTTP